MFKRLLLPTLIALLALSQIVVGITGASSIRSDQKRAAAITRHKAAVRREKAAVAHYQQVVQPMVVAVYDAVQPLQDADDAFAVTRPGLAAARDDVLDKSGTLVTLRGVISSLAAVKPPKTLVAQHAELVTQVKTLGTAASALSAATHAKGDAHGYVEAFGTGFELLLSAESSWLDAVDAVYGSVSALPTPAASRAGAHGRHVPTKGSFIFASDLACAKASTSLHDLPDRAAADDIRLNFPKAATIIRTALKSLLAVKPPAAAAAGGHQLDLALEANSAVPTAMDAMSAALKRSDLTAYDAALKTYEAAFTSAQTASRAYQSYGVSVCTFFFDVDRATKGSGSTGQSA